MEQKEEQKEEYKQIKEKINNIGLCSSLKKEHNDFYQLLCSILPGHKSENMIYSKIILWRFNDNDN